MRIGVQSGAARGDDNTIDGLVAQGKRLESLGFATMSMANVFGLDAINALSIVGRETERIELATGVVPTYPRHPVAMAQQALTAQVACGGRFVLGIGLSHKVVIENMLGMSYEKPARHMHEYLRVLAPLLRCEPTRFSGDSFNVDASLDVPGTSPVPLLVAALGPLMLDLAGRIADGTVTWMVGPRTLESHVIPRIRAAARDAARPQPVVVAGFPVALTSNPDAARDEVSQQMQMYGVLPSYRAMLDREGAAGPGDVALLGDEKVVRERLTVLRDLGVDDFQAVPVSVEEGAVSRTLEFLASLIPELKT